MSTVDHTFRAMGCDVRIVGAAAARTDDDLVAAAARAERFIHAAAARLTRFDAASELNRLTAGGGRAAVSPILRRAIVVALHAARATRGLIDPTLGTAVARAGYPGTFDPARRAPLTELLAAAPPRRAARPRPDAAWPGITVDDDRGAVRLPRGTTLDVGATAKGLLADLALELLGPVDHGFVDAGGDVALRSDHPSEVLAADPFDRDPVLASVAGGTVGVATSSIAGRCWWRSDGTPAHHLLDPATGEPAFTGVVQATAAAPTAAGAEQLAGQALLSGPAAARELLARHGGLLVLDDATTLRIEGALLR